MTRRVAAGAVAAIVATAAASGACTNDYDGLAGAGGASTAAGSGGGGAAPAGPASTSTATTSTGGGAGDGGASSAGGGSPGAGGAGGAQPLPGEAACAGVALDFDFDVATDLPAPWTREVAGEVSLSTADGHLQLLFVGNGRDRGALTAPLPTFDDCSVTLEVPEDPRWNGPESALAAAFVRASSGGDDLPALAIVWGVDATGEPTVAYVGALELPVGAGDRDWEIGPLDRGDVRFLRLRASAGAVHYDVSADGVAWDTLGAIEAMPDEVAVGAWKEGTLDPDEDVTVLLGPVNGSAPP